MNNAFHRLHSLRMENDAVKYTMDDLRPRFDGIANRHVEGTAPRAVSAYQLFQTPPPLAARLASLLPLTSASKVLEPSAGLGRLIDAIAKAAPGAPVVAVEKAPQLAAELFRKYQSGVKLLQRDFLQCSPDELGQFDAVAMNPPFHMRDDIRHILHARKFLLPGATLAALCLDTQHRHSALKPLADHWEIIPAGEFRAEGTQVQTVLLTMKG
jgi:predicted RNA methylase